jgi:hypothetical protein
VRNPFTRAIEVPADVIARAALPRGEKALASARAVDGTWLLGSRAALHIVPPTSPSVGPVETTVIPWECVETADWDREGERLRVSEVGEFGKVRPVHIYEVQQAALLLTLVRERVTASVVMQRRVAISGGKGLFVIARRSPTGAGDIDWAFEYDAGVDPADPEVSRLAETALRTAAEELGL